jgi:GST-like protein
MPCTSSSIIRAGHPGDKSPGMTNSYAPHVALSARRISDIRRINFRNLQRARSKLAGGIPDRAPECKGNASVPKLYFHSTPNSMKVALYLEELGTPYEIVPIDIFKGEQHSAEFLTINPNGKVPAFVDDGITVFDSHAILLHLAERHRRFVPTAAAEGAAMLSWLEFVATGLSPFSGQAVHFLHYAPEKLPYAINRYVKEVERHYRVLDQRLSDSKYLAGPDYSIADMALWGWAISAGYIFGDKGLNHYPNVQRLVTEIGARPAAARAQKLKEKASFKHELDAESRRAMFPQNESAAA